MSTQDWYKLQEIAPGITAIGEPRYHQQNWSYLICGSDAALLFDTGSYYGDMAPVVASLTDLPLTVLPSHMHYDHLGNITAFERIVLPDLPVLRACEADGRVTPSDTLFLGDREDRTPPSFGVADWLAPGSMIDLGGRQLQLIHTPGHSPDSVSLWDAEAGILFAGDYLYDGALYAQVPGASLRGYLETAGQLGTLLPTDARILGAHGDAKDETSATAPTLDTTVLGRLMICLSDLMMGPAPAEGETLRANVQPGVDILVNSDAHGR
ncbi:MBL fold metallo-hydrolase [Roseovarius nanhaiticus]|uniref:MBL fold metallo-hydrolase n=1 Tax=Roseovarius nanhaiticus TaxID=573024 RepID=UPI002491E290|nr:MBL fold metallo-hydrolase [Roseovarius nanhaiticus]